MIGSEEREVGSEIVSAVQGFEWVARSSVSASLENMCLLKENWCLPHIAQALVIGLVIDPEGEIEIFFV